jgi:signal transduction histidine kinase
MQQQIEQLKDQLKKQEKLASLGVLSAGIAHEIQNPLNFVINFSKISDKLLEDLIEILDDYKDKLSDDDREEIDDIVADLKENMCKITEHGERAIDIVRGILLVSRGKKDEYIPTDIGKIVKEFFWLSFHAMRANHKDFHITVHEHYDAGIPEMMVIPQDLSRAVINVANNAFYAVWKKSQTVHEGYNPEVSVSVGVNDENVYITIADNGEGMTDEVKLHVYENFFTTKPAGQGTGLGMGITRDIIENKHHGNITFESVEGEGSKFVFILPIKK